jgi:hypothetical protein
MSRASSSEILSQAIILKISIYSDLI